MEKPQEQYQPLKDEKVLKNVPSRFSTYMDLLHGGAEHVIDKEGNVPRLELNKGQIEMVKATEEFGFKEGDTIDVYYEELKLDGSVVEDKITGKFIRADDANMRLEGTRVLSNGIEKELGIADKGVKKFIIPINNITKIEKHE